MQSSNFDAVRYEGRMIYYSVADEDGNVNDEVEGPCFNFKGHSLEELTMKLEEETGLESIIVCTKNKLHGKICPMRLGLPPNNATMYVVVVPSTSKCKNLNTSASGICFMFHPILFLLFQNHGLFAKLFIMSCLYAFTAIV